MYIRRDSTWNVPEPELTLFISSEGSIEGYTIGNDLSSRSIEGENPLYLPQAKTWDRCAALGPCLYLPDEPISLDTTVELQITRGNTLAFKGHTEISQMKRNFNELIQFLFRECEFPIGCFLMTGTGIVPPDNFTLKAGDEVIISIEGIGELFNVIETRN
jgi:2-dehydro-3-deoxy-D-arabinonate dehydratase